jgi:hypothetical protein
VLVQWLLRITDSEGKEIHDFSKWGGKNIKDIQHRPGASSMIITYYW